MAIALAAGAALFTPVELNGQAVPVPIPKTDSSKAKAKLDSAGRDTTAVDSTRRDSTKFRQPEVPDTIKPPLAHAFVPAATDLPGKGWHWNRDSLFASGALNLGELLAMVPGVTSLGSGFFWAPSVAAWNGDPGAVQIIYDGVMVDPMNVRNGGISELSLTPLWSLEDVTIERGAGMLRVHLRSWRVDRVIPQTRVDVYNGSENFTLYRGFYGKRLANGLAIQAGARQAGTVANTGPYGDGLSALLRIGWANKNWKVDGTYTTSGVTRAKSTRFLLAGAPPQTEGIPAFVGGEGLSYLRFAWHDPEHDGPWAQLIAASLYAGEKHQVSSIGGTSAPKTGTDTVDTLVSRKQYVVAAGITKWGVRLSTSSRIRVINKKSYFTPNARAEYMGSRLSFSAVTEQGIDSTVRADFQARFLARDWLSVGGALSSAKAKDTALGPAIQTARVEAGVRFRDRWIVGGFITRSASRVLPPIVFDTSMRIVNVKAASGATLSIRGPVWRGWSIDVDGVSWNDAASYRPQRQLRSRLWFESSFLGRFPRGNFHVKAAVQHEFASVNYIPKGTDPFGQSSVKGGYSIYSSLLEIRISSAVITWQYRNMAGTPYEQVPGFLMPRLVNVYGVRWEFWN